MEANEVTGVVISAAMKIHSAFGPGLLESAYRACLCHELRQRGMRVGTETVLPIVYDGVAIDAGYRVDLVVQDMVLVELKAIAQLKPVHRAQLLSYLKLSGRSIGLLINFHVKHLRMGICRIVNRVSGEADLLSGDGRFRRAPRLATGTNPGPDR
jgi:GxxExxY protein